MPSQITHLVVAKKYLEKHAQEIKDVQKFLDGNVVPDLVNDKTISHCGVRTEKRDVLKYNREKVNPEKFAATHNMNDDFNKGQYLHLYVDYQFYNVFLLEYHRREIDKEQRGTDLYETSRRDDLYLQQKYCVSYDDTSVASELYQINAAWDEENAEKRRQPEYKFTFPYDFMALEQFIEQVSNVVIPC